MNTKRLIVVLVSLAAALMFLGCSSIKENILGAQVPQTKQVAKVSVPVPAPVFNEGTTTRFVQFIIEKEKNRMVAYVGSSAGKGPKGNVYHNKQVMEFWNPQFKKSDLTLEERQFLLSKGVKFEQNFFSKEGAGQQPGIIWFDLLGPDRNMIRQIYMKWADKYGKTFPKEEGRWINSKTATAIVTAGLTIKGWKATRVGVHGFWYKESIPEQ